MKIIENVNLWFAKDSNNNTITIDTITDKNKNNKYYCPICGSEVYPKLGNKLSHHFAHIDKSKCTGETMIHFWIKNEIIKVGDKFKIKYGEDIKEYICKSIYIEKCYKTKYGKYKPDITIHTESDEILYFEIAKSNKKDVDNYMSKWLDLNNTVVEVEIKDMINHTDTFKAIYNNGKCYKEFKHNEHINKIKHEIIDKTNIEEAKERISKIEWFWDEFIKYKKTGEEIPLFESIDYIEEVDREYLIDGYLKTSCSKLRKLYLLNNQNNIYNNLYNFINDNNLNKYVNLYKSEELLYRNKLDKNFIIPCVIIKFNDKENRLDYLFDKIKPLKIPSDIVNINNLKFNKIKKYIKFIIEKFEFINYKSDIINRYVRDINNKFLYGLVCKTNGDKSFKVTLRIKYYSYLDIDICNIYDDYIYCLDSKKEYKYKNINEFKIKLDNIISSKIRELRYSN